MYQIFCHELEDMGNSLLNSSFVLFLVVFVFFFVCWIVVELRSSLVICYRLPSNGKLFLIPSELKMLDILSNYGRNSALGTNFSAHYRHYRFIGSSALTETH